MSGLAVGAGWRSLSTVPGSATPWVSPPLRSEWPRLSRASRSVLARLSRAWRPVWVLLWSPWAPAEECRAVARKVGGQLGYLLEALSVEVTALLVVPGEESGLLVTVVAGAWRWVAGEFAQDHHSSCFCALLASAFISLGCFR